MAATRSQRSSTRINASWVRSSAFVPIPGDEAERQVELILLGLEERLELDGRRDGEVGLGFHRSEAGDLAHRRINPPRTSNCLHGRRSSLAGVREFQMTKRLASRSMPTSTARSVRSSRSARDAPNSSTDLAGATIGAERWERTERDEGSKPRRRPGVDPDDGDRRDALVLPTASRTIMPVGRPMAALIVLKVDIPAGTDMDRLIWLDQFRLIEVPKEAAVDGAVTSIDQLRGESNRVAILAGEQIPIALFWSVGAMRRERLEFLG